MAIGRIIGRVAIKVIPDTTDFREDVRNDLNGKEKPGDIKVRVIPEVRKSDLDKVRRELERWADRISPIEVVVRPDLAGTNARVISARLRALTRPRDVKITPKLNERGVASIVGALSALSGLRFVLGMFKNFREELMNLDKAIPKIGLISHAIAGLGAWGLTAAGNIFSLTNSIAQMGLAGLALPGILGGIAVGMGVTVAALKDFNTYVPQAAVYMHKLQDVISQNFWEKAAGPIRGLVDELFPALIVMVGKTATALGGFFGNLATSLGGKLLPALGPMFDNLNKSIEIFSKHTDAIANIIAVLGSLGASYLPQLAEWFGKITERFSAWLTESDKAGKLTAWVDTGIIRIKEFAGVIAGLVGVFHGIGEAAAAAGGSTLGSLADGLARAAAVANSPAFQTGLTATLASAYGMMGQIARIAGPALETMIVTLSKNFQLLAPTIGDTLGTAIKNIATLLSSPALTTGLLAMFQGFNNMAHSLAPAMEPLAQKLGVLLQVVGALATNIGMVLAKSIETFAPTFAKVATAALPLINMLGPMMTKVLSDLQPYITQWSNNLAKVVTAIGPLVQSLMNLWNLIAPVLIPVLTFLAKLIGETIVMAIHGITNVINGLVTFIQGVVQVVQGIFTGDFAMVWNGLKDMIGGVLQLIWGLIETYIAIGALKLITGAFKGIMALGKGFTGDFFTLLAELWSSVLSRIGTVFNEIRAVPSNAMNAILGFIRGVAGDLKAAFQLVWDGMLTALKTAWSNTKDFLDGIPGKIKGVFAGAAGWLIAAGSDIIKGLIGGIDSMIDKVKEKLKGLTDLIPSWKGPRDRDKRLLTPAGELIIDGLIKGLESQFGSVKDALNDLTTDIAAYVGKSMSEEISKALSLSLAEDVTAAIRTEALVSGVSIDSQLGGLDAQISKAWKEISNGSNKSESISIGNITIPLEDLKQLKDLNEFLDLLRVRTRQGAA